jgi:hypothetical protein
MCIKIRLFKGRAGVGLRIRKGEGRGRIKFYRGKVLRWLRNIWKC